VPIVARLYFKERAQGARRKTSTQGARIKNKGARIKNKTKHRRNNLIVVDGNQLIYIKPMQLCILTKDETQ
jgi:hypothetical protein